MYNDATSEEINIVMENAWKAFHQFRKISLKQRSDFMKQIGIELENDRLNLIHIAMKETNLSDQRLNGELSRTILQLNQYGNAAEKGEWLEARINTGVQEGITSKIVSDAIFRAIEKCKIPKGTFAHIYGQSIDVGKQLVMHEHTKAVGFTGSFQGGKQLFDWGNQRKIPIPVFAEMGSINPVFLLPKKMQESSIDIAKTYAKSITVGVGQFCTNPGLIIGLKVMNCKNSLQLLVKK